MNELTFRIVYPVNRIVTESEVRMQYSDAVANGECSDVGQNIEDIMYEMDVNCGLVTFSKQDRSDMHSQRASERNAGNGP